MCGQVCDISLNVDAKSLLKFRELYSMRILCAYSCGLCSLFTPHQSTVLGMKSNVEPKFCLQATDRTGGESYCSLAVAVVQIVHGTALLAVYIRLQSERCFFLIQSDSC